MAKINLPPITGGFNLSTINSNFDKVEAALNDRVLYRDTPIGEPNQLFNGLDMNANRIYNLPQPLSSSEPARLFDLEGAIFPAFNKTLRVSDVDVPSLPNKGVRANKFLSFDINGNPQVTYPSEDSAIALRLDLAADSGSLLVGYLSSGVGAVVTDVQSKLRDMVSVKDFGADYTGAADSSAAFTAAFTASKRVTVPDGVYRITNVMVPKDSSLELSQGTTLQTAATSGYMVRVQAGGTVKGGLFDTTNVDYNGTAISVNGDDQATNGFALHIETNIETSLKGKYGVGRGAALYIHADGLPTARVMGVNAKLRIDGFTQGVWLRQTSMDGSQFINGCRIDAWCSSTLQALYMDAPSGAVHLDANIIRIQHQPLIGSAMPSALIAGQYNKIYITPWDWADILPTQPYAVVILLGARYNDIDITQEGQYLQNNSGNTLNSIKTLTHDYNERIVNMGQRFYPPYPSGTLQSNCAIYAGGGVPSDSLGVNGDVYFNSGGGSGISTLYQRRGSTWVGVV